MWKDNEEKKMLWVNKYMNFIFLHLYRSLEEKKIIIIKIIFVNDVLNHDK